MTTRRTFVISSTLTARGAGLLALTLAAMPCTASGQQVKRSSETVTPSIRSTAPTNAAALATRQRFLEMFARAYVPGRTGQLLIVPREGDIITRPDPDVAFMHGSPWAYDVSIPLMFVGPAVRTGLYSMPAVQQDVAPTLAAALGVRMPPTATGRVLPVFRTGRAQPRVVMLLVHSGERQLSPNEHRGWTLHHLDGNRSSRARNHGCQRVRPHPPRALRPIRWRNAARSSGIDARRRLATHDGWPRDHIGPRQHRSSRDAARGSRSVSVEWGARRARELRSADWQLERESRLFPAARISEGSQRENTVVG